MRTVGFTLVLAMTMSGGAAAQPVQAGESEAALNLSSPRTTFAVRYEPETEPRLRGVAQTSVERRLSEDGLKAAMGFMCGLEPGKAPRGGAAMRGHDPTGRFVGARLSLAFR